MCDKQMHRDLAWLKVQGEKFRAELEKGEEGRYPELAGLIREVKRDPK